MGDFFSDLFRFIYTILSYWQAYATGGVIAMAVGLYERLTEKHLSKRVYAGLFVFTFLFAAFFLAWRDEHKAVENLKLEVEQTKKALDSERQNNAPQLSAEIEEIIFGAPQDGNTSRAFVFILLTIRNTGSPSVATSWWLHLKSKDLDLTIPPTQLPDEFKTTDQNGYPVVFHGKEAIYEKAMQPIQRGSIVRGWAGYIVQGVTLKQLSSSETEYTVTFFDVIKRPHTVSMKIGDLAPRTPRYYPGAEQPFLPATMPTPTPKK
jgi:hypothetical protein